MFQYTFTKKLSEKLWEEQLATSRKMNGSLWASAGYIWSLHYLYFFLNCNFIFLNASRWQNFTPNTKINTKKQLKSNLDNHLSDFFHKNVIFHMQANGVVNFFLNRYNKQMPTNINKLEQRGTKFLQNDVRDW